MNIFKRRQLEKSRRSFALIIVLFLVVVLSSLLIAFVSIMQLDRQSTQSYAQGVRAEQIARGAFENIESQMVDEIAANSTRYGADGTPTGAKPYLYWPVNATNMLIQPSGVAGWPPLIKMSKNASNFYVGGTTLASATSSTNAASNGRLLSLARWNKPLFFTNWPSSVPAPDWVYVTRSGPQVVTVSQARDAAIANNNFAIGRYAFTVYDVSGLLDITTAGYIPSGYAGISPSSDTVQPFIGRKGNTMLSELTNIPNGTVQLTQAQINALVQWRNQTSYTNSQFYVTNFASTNGGLVVFPGDNTFINRQDLISFAQANAITNALPYFTTFHRSLNAPSFRPDADAIAAPSPYAYFSNATNIASTNICFPNLRVTSSTWSRVNDDGTTTAAVIGEPLVKMRFPLTRLGLFTQATPNATQMSAYFGLTEGAGGIHDAWIYNALDASGNICTLKEVAAAGREANFFELLKAAILSGSLGRDVGNSAPFGASAIGPRSETELASSSMDLNIMRIGVNIIDQYGANNFPTTINTKLFPATSTPDNLLSYVYGIKNLPYYQRSTMLAADNTPPGFDGSGSVFQVWIQPVIWNPHQNTASVTGVPAVSGPTTFRIQAFGASCATVHYAKVPASAGASTATSTVAAGTWNPYLPDTDNSHPLAYIQFSGSHDFWTNPAPLTAAIADSSGTPTNNYCGLYSPAIWPPPASIQPVAFELPAGGWAPDNTAKTNTAGINFGWQPQATGGATSTNPNNGTYFALQWLDGSTWRTYQVVGSIQNNTVGNTDFTAVTAGHFTALNATTGVFGTNIIGDGFAHYDVRTDRFGVGVPTATTTGIIAFGLTNSMRPAVSPATEFNAGSPTNNSLGGAFVYDNGSAGAGTPTAASGFYPATLSQNTNAAGYSGVTTYMYYTDRDGVLRGADGLYASGAAANLPDGYPLAVGANSYATNSQRPLIINRPFRSPGELGYAFRDLPFKTLDFFTPQSADYGLLDVFSVNASATNSGMVNLNSAPGPVIKALLDNGLKKEVDTTQVMNADVSVIATYLTNQLAAIPMVHRGDLVTALAGLPVSSSRDQSDKTQRETSIRSLSEVADPRTWNLMIDVIAQAGRFPPQASNLNTDFQVQAEKRYWLHLSIDRMTGQIIASQLEPVYE